MSIFGKIRDAIFGRREQAEPSAMPQMGTPGDPNFGRGDTAAAAVQPVDVDAVLARLAAERGQPSNYKSSIVDLMKLLDLDSSLENRKELARELGYTGATDGSAEMNMWLHREVMAKLATNGGKVSPELQG